MSETASGVLRDEHQRILGVADALETMLNETAGGGASDPDALSDCVTFFRLFADACHHAKEEDLLFPELESAGLPHDDGPIAVMLDEHRRGRLFVKAMADAHPGVRAGDAGARATFERNARAYIDLIRNHITKEDNVLFMMADHSCTEPPAASFVAHTSGPTGACSRNGPRRNSKRWPPDLPTVPEFRCARKAGPATGLRSAPGPVPAPAPGDRCRRQACTID